MKRILGICLVVMIMASANNAFASRARQMVMGTGDPLGVLSPVGSGHGSFYYDDNYNIFYNPSYANDWKNWVAVEKSNGPINSAGSGAEGGFVSSMMNFSVGAFFNRGGALKGTYQLPVGTAVPAATMSPIDVIIAGDMGVKWGLGLTYANSKRPGDLSASELSARLGAQISGFEPFVDFLITGKDKLTAGTERKNKNFTGGLKYHWGEWTPYAAFQSVTTHTLVATPVETKNTNWGLGIGRNTKFAESATVNYSIGFWNGKTDTTDTKTMIVPINVSVEAELASWVIGRVGMTHNLMNNSNAAGAGASSAGATATTGRLGATFKFAKIDMDWAVGNVAGTETLDGATFDVANGLFAAASLTYRW
jgi:hypothetical protein